MERKHVESGGGCEREEEEVCVFDMYKCESDFQDLSAPTHTETSLVDKT
jgi:hypothetical protein